MILHTARLTLRPVTPDDIPALAAHWNESRVRRYLFDGEPVTAERAIELVGTARHGVWVVTTAPDAPLCGVCGLWPHTDPDTAEIVYSIEPDRWGQGFATEAAEAVLTHAFTKTTVAAVIAAMDEGNAASVRVAERLGLRRLPDGTAPLGVLRRYTVGRIAWPGRGRVRTALASPHGRRTACASPTAACPRTGSGHGN